MKRFKSLLCNLNFGLKWFPAALQAAKFIITLPKALPWAVAPQALQANKKERFSLARRARSAIAQGNAGNALGKINNSIAACKAARSLIFLFCIIFNSLFAQESKPVVIDADIVDYNGKIITLQGNSTVDHELGKIRAQQITLIPDNEDKKLRFAYLKMHDEVEIALHDGGQLSCENAEIDYHKLTGNFSGGPQQEYVIYTENLKGRDPKVMIPLQIKSRLMGIHLRRENQPGSSGALVISQITADNDVSVNYNNDFRSIADHGLYERQEQGQGFLSLGANEQSGICQVSNRNGDLINANKISIDTSKRELQFDSPKGSIFTHNGDELDSEIDFSCGNMAWNEPQDVLILRDQVEVNYKGVGALTNPDEIRIHRTLIDGHKKVSMIDGIGHSVLNYRDEKKNESHVLTTHNSFVLDRQRMQAHLDSPRDANKNVLENLQVHFADSMGEIYADEMYVNYQEINNRMTPVKIFLKGNVWLLSRSSADKEDPGKILQFAMADRLEYDVPTKEMLCMADGNKRVLFFDKNNNLQVSAPSVKARRDPLTKKDAIQGMGDVRFSFIEKEYEQLKKRFESKWQP